MPFTPKDWRDLPDTTTPVNAAELERIEAGLAEAMATAEAAEARTVHAAKFSNLQAALDAVEDQGGGGLVLEDIAYDTATEFTYSADAGPITLRGSGAKSAIRATGTTNGALRIYGTPGATTNQVRVTGIAFDSDVSGAGSPQLLHLEGIAFWWVTHCDFLDTVKSLVGIRCSAAQQGEIASGAFRTKTGIVLEPVGGVHSNGVEIHANSLACSVLNIQGQALDSAFIHSNHLVAAPMSVHILGGGLGTARLSGNHIESHATVGVLVDGDAVVENNQFFGLAGSKDLEMTAGTVRAVGNLLQRNVTIGAAAAATVEFNHWVFGASLTDNAPATQYWGNVGTGWNHAQGNRFDGRLSTTSRAEAASTIADFHANPLIGGPWGIAVHGAGADQDVYLQLHSALVAGNTAGGVIKFLSGVGGTEWGRFDGVGLSAPGLVALGTTPTVTAGHLGIGSSTATSVGAAGAASPLPATPSGYLIVNLGGTPFKIPFFAS